MKVHLQTLLNGEWFSEDCYKLSRAFSEKGYDVVKFNANLIPNGVSLTYGERSVVNRTIQAIRSKVSRLSPYPHRMRRGFIEWDPVESTLDDMLERIQDKNYIPLCISPRSGANFEDTIINTIDDILPMMSYGGDTQVWANRLIDWVTKYRIFVHHNEMVGMSHVSGDPLIYPDLKVIKRMMSRAKTSITAHAYALDIGVAEFPERPYAIRNPTLLIKAVDAYFMKSYGLDKWIFAQMVEDRWKQLTS